MRFHSEVLHRPAERATICSRLAEAAGRPALGAARAADWDGVQVGEHIIRAGTRTWSSLLDLYLEGWADADISKILAATAHDYRFDDPLVGPFSRPALPAYFEHLQARFAAAGAVAAADLVFFIRGPMHGPRRRGRLEFFREAPRLGLTGITVITVGEGGILAESVAYDLNMASDLLRGRSPRSD